MVQRKLGCAENALSGGKPVRSVMEQNHVVSGRQGVNQFWNLIVVLVRVSRIGRDANDQTATATEVPLGDELAANFDLLLIELDGWLPAVDCQTKSSDAHPLCEGLDPPFLDERRYPYFIG